MKITEMNTQTDEDFIVVDSLIADPTIKDGVIVVGLIVDITIKKHDQSWV